MTELAQLRSRIAALVGDDPLPTQQKTKPLTLMLRFLENLPHDEIDAVYVVDGSICKTFGNAEQLRQAALTLAVNASETGAVMICEVNQAAGQIVFCASEGQDLVVLRTSAFGADELLMRWRAAH